MIERESLARRVESLSKELAEMIRAKESRIEQADTPFFEKGSIYFVIYLGEYRPTGFSVGCADPDFTVLLANNRDGFIRLAKEANVRLESANDAIRYVTCLLETTRDFARRFQVIRRFDDIELIPKASSDEQAEYKQLREKYGAVIHAPKVTSAQSWKVELFALREQKLIRFEIKVEPNGEVEIAEVPLEENLPIAIQR